MTKQNRDFPERIHRVTNFPMSWVVWDPCLNYFVECCEAGAAPPPPFALLLARAAAARFRLWLGSQLQSQYELKKFIALTEEFWQTQSPQNRGGGGRLRQHWYCLILTAAVPPQSAAWCRIKSVSELISEASAWADVPATSNSISSPRTGSTNYVHIVRVWWPCFREAQNLEDDQACFRRAHIGL